MFEYFLYFYFRWRNYGSKTLKLQKLAIKVLSLTFSSSGYEKNWSTFEHARTKKKDLVHRDN